MNPRTDTLNKAEQLHAEHCTHQARQVPTSCDRDLEDMYNSIDIIRRDNDTLRHKLDVFTGKNLRKQTEMREQ